MEMLRLRTTPWLAKLAGVIVSLGGAATLAFYKGPHIKLWCHHILLHGHHNINRPSHPSSGMIWVKGCFLMLSSNFCWSLWLVLQGRIIKSYPSKLMLTTLQCFMSSIQSLVIAIPLVRDPTQWKLDWNIRLLAVAYCGMVVTGLTYYLQAWVIEKRGPVFLAMSSPLALIITILFSAFVLCEKLTFGSILGGVLLVGGLYSVLWGKSREQTLDQGNCKPPEVDQECSQFKQEEASHKSPDIIV
ncbi:hypothetical protein NL676_014092 [Syzygium grande]|nr:hypothetical protein NL676_014092 [Syzygium grande]